MAYVSIAGITVLATDINEDTPEVIGEVVRAFAGNARAVVRAQKRRWSVTGLYISESEYQTLKSAVALYAPVIVTGDFVSSASITCYVEMSGEFMHDSGSHLRIPKLSLIEV